jgi:hypothetical protein
MLLLRCHNNPKMFWLALDRLLLRHGNGGMGSNVNGVRKKLVLTKRKLPEKTGGVPMSALLNNDDINLKQKISRAIRERKESGL